eukprot:TRINITY_DN3695_c0_g2_i1.p1 TRINITY_DN3695_c0_g2~~TRINITY_DN3695_c0_g2_i1.p1  ORF type:complete len:390 (+),score=55.32 TRINITY_DN3695_c0_g2_i1:73-1242(+)
MICEKRRRAIVANAKVFIVAVAVGSCGEYQSFEDECPLPPPVSVYHPPLNTALASHARAGSTWLRFLLERALGLPCGFQKPDWANVLPHYGEHPESSTRPNVHGLVIKTHNSCYGCWNDASLDERLSIDRNSDVNRKELEAAVGKNLIHRLQSNGTCLIAAGQTLTQTFERAIHGGDRAKQRVEHVACDLTYDRAVLLVRQPIDNIKSNYHYRTAVLRMRPSGSWATDDHAFPKERGEAWVEVHRSWLRFAQVRPLLIVRYEDMQQNATRELRRIVDFLGFVNVSDARLECAVRASSMDRLKESDRFALGSDATFFGTREMTEKREQLSVPPKLFQHFQGIGMFEMAKSLGYQLSEELVGEATGEPVSETEGEYASEDTEEYYAKKQDL